jgi:signal transduction histidine kinase
MENARPSAPYNGENPHDKYELLEYFVGKLDNRGTPREMYAFLLDFLQVIVGDRKEPVPGCVFIVNNETAAFEPLVLSGDGCSEAAFKAERDRQVDSGIIPWCIANKRLAFADTGQNGYGKYSIVMPLFTVKRILGLVILFTNRSEADISRASFKILNLACLQTCLYADIMEMYDQLKRTQSRLIQSEKLSGIGQLAAGVAHEINNPVGFVSSNLSTLTGYIARMKQMLEIYRKNAESTEMREKEKELKIDVVLNDIDELMKENGEGIKRIGEIVQAMKNFARTEQKKERARANINDGIKSALIMARNEIKYHADVQTEFGDISLVECNIGEVNQVFLNILVNAAQAIKEQKRSDRGSIRVKTYERDSRVICEFSDDGPGIAKDILTRIFDPFFTTKPIGAGTGLGLSIAYDIIVNKHKGYIEAKSKEGEGATFIVRLPINAAEKS